jgi:hypothetical protein
VSALDIDVTVGHDGVTVYANGTAAAADGRCPSPFTFPQVGGRTTWGDEACSGTCMSDVMVWAGGTATPAADPTGDPIHIAVDVTAAPDAVLELTGCGGSASIPIGGLHAPTPTQLTAAQTAGGAIAVSWSADSPAETTLLKFGATVWSELVHVPGTSYTFTPTFGPADQYHSVDVETFDTMSSVDTPFGIVKIWPGDWSPSAAAVAPM